MTREEWLRDAARWAADEVFQNPELFNRIRVTCGWPSRRPLARKNRAIGECWDETCSAAGVNEILVSPFQSEGVQVLETLLHEMVHAEVGVKEGHKKAFIERAKAIGFLPPWKSTPPTIELTERLMGYVATHEPYPHAVLDTKHGEDKPAGETKKKVPAALCSECGYTLRIAKKYIELGLPPHCVCGGHFALEEVA
jgi:hypothetical protein